MPGGSCQIELLDHGIRIEFISDAPYGLDHGAVRAETVTDRFYMGVHGAPVSAVAVSPDILKKLVPSHDSSGIFRKLQEKIKFLRSKDQLLPGDGGSAGIRVDLKLFILIEKNRLFLSVAL